MKEKGNKDNSCTYGCLLLFVIEFIIKFFIFDINFHGYYITYKGAFLSALWTIDLWVMYLLMIGLVFFIIVLFIKKIISNIKKWND